jgi:ribose transport system permease protein
MAEMQPDEGKSQPSYPVAEELRYLLRQLASGPVIGLVSVLGVFILLFAIKGELDELRNFLGVENLQVLVFQITPKAVVVLAMLMIMVTGGIDLSVGSVVALVTVVTMVGYRFAYAQTGSAAAASLYAVAAGIGTGGLCGLTNGLVITRLKVSPFVTTLGMMSVARGVAYWLAERRAVSFGASPKPDWVATLSETFPERTLFNPGAWSVVPLAILTAVLLKASILGRHAYAIGSNEDTARLCGVPIVRTKVVIYALAGLLTGWAGVLLFTQVHGDPSGSVGLELDVIAAAVIGGASLGGGQGGVGGVLLGVLILGVLNNGVIKFHLPVETQYILSGVIIIANTAVSRWRKRE